MWNPEWPPVAILLGMGLAVIFFSLQLLALFGSRRRLVHWLPAVPVLLGTLVTLVLSAGIVPLDHGLLAGAGFLTIFLIAAPTFCAALGLLLACLCWKVITLCS